MEKYLDFMSVFSKADSRLGTRNLKGSCSQGLSTWLFPLNELISWFTSNIVRWQCAGKGQYYKFPPILASVI